MFKPRRSSKSKPRELKDDEREEMVARLMAGSNHSGTARSPVDIQKKSPPHKRLAAQTEPANIELPS